MSSPEAGGWVKVTFYGLLPAGGTLPGELSPEGLASLCALFGLLAADCVTARIEAEPCGLPVACGSD